MKTITKKARQRPGKRIVMDCTVPDSPQSAFVALFAPCHDESWPNVACSYLFAGNEKTTRTMCTTSSERE